MNLTGRTSTAWFTKQISGITYAKLRIFPKFILSLSQDFFLYIGPLAHRNPAVTYSWRFCCRADGGRKPGLPRFTVKMEVIMATDYWRKHQIIWEISLEWSIHKVTLRQAQLALRWLTICGYVCKRSLGWINYDVAKMLDSKSNRKTRQLG